MKKQLIRLTENDLHRIIEKSVRAYLNEDIDECGLGEGEKLDKFKKGGKYALGAAAAAAALYGAEKLGPTPQETNDAYQQSIDTDHAFQQYKAMDDYRTAHPFGESKRRSGVKITEGMLRKIVNQSIKNILG